MSVPKLRTPMEAYIVKQLFTSVAHTGIDVSYEDLAKIYGVSSSTIWRILNFVGYIPKSEICNRLQYSMGNAAYINWLTIVEKETA